MPVAVTAAVNNNGVPYDMFPPPQLPFWKKNYTVVTLCAQARSISDS